MEPIKMYWGCVVSLPSKRLREQGYSLNPGRYVGVAAREDEDFDFRLGLEQLHGELELLNAEAHALEQRVLAEYVRTSERLKVRNDVAEGSSR